MATDIQSRLMAGADLGALSLPQPAPVTAPSKTAPRPVPRLAAMREQPPAHSCQQMLTLSFFFDGTGNNLDADVDTWEHSNVARLYRAHLEDSEAMGRFRYYLPGIGTYFKDREVQDPGGTLTGRAFAALGQARLNWAFARMREKIAAAEARAENPTNKICWIKVSVFGFSRGAALARAFCRDLQQRCVEDPGASTGWRLKQGGHPIEIVFAGLFDTVAASGVPPSGNNLQRNRYVKALEWTNPVAKGVKALLETPELKRLAFGNAPGADPAPGVADGHGGWADGLAIGKMVKRCLHLMAAHEMRNSFPLDTALYAQSEYRFVWPAGCTEMLYPGVHSDIGGGYRPGEAGCRPERGAQLSLITLRVMYSAAIESVPLVPLTGLTAKEREDFAIDDEGARHFAAMTDLWNHYRSVASGYGIPGATIGLGHEINKHMRLYFAWRFRAMRESREAEAGGRQTEQQQQVERQERQFAGERAVIAKELSAAGNELLEAQQRQELSRILLENARMNQQRYGTPIDPAVVQRHELHQRETERRQIAYDRVRARKSTAADDSKLNAAIGKYDQMLHDDARQIVKWARDDPTLKLRPHYYALVEAYLDEFERSQGLRDAKVVEFFDEYVHDSLAGFATDETWPSDPRIVYVGGDNKLRYAGLHDALGSQPTAA